MEKEDRREEWRKEAEGKSGEKRQKEREEKGAGREEWRKEAEGKSGER